jgi:hypothetical protein
MLRHVPAEPRRDRYQIYPEPQALDFTPVSSQALNPNVDAGIAALNSSLHEPIRTYDVVWIRTTTRHYQGEATISTLWFVTQKPAADDEPYGLKLLATYNG